MQHQKIDSHEGKKYLRKIRDARDPRCVCDVDVYAVLKAFRVENAPVSHAIKKLLCAGDRGKGSYLDDLIGAQAALFRAIEEAKADLEETTSVDVDEVRKQLEAVAPFIDSTGEQCIGVIPGTGTASFMDKQAVASQMRTWMRVAEVTPDTLQLDNLPSDCPLVQYQLTRKSIDDIMAILKQPEEERASSNVGDMLGKIVAERATVTTDSPLTEEE
jgi:hypothetical protein